MSFLKATDAPYILLVDEKTYTFPRLKLRAQGVLLEKYRAEQLARAKKLLDSEKVKNETTRCELLSKIVLADYPLETLYDWSILLSGSVAIAKESLLVSGKTVKEADEILDELTPEQIRDAAMEAVQHFNRLSVREENKKLQDEADKSPNE